MAARSRRVCELDAVAHHSSLRWIPSIAGHHPLSSAFDRAPSFNSSVSPSRSNYDANCFPSMNWHDSIRLTIIGQIDSNFLRVIEKNSQFEEKSLKYCDLNKLFRYYIFSLLSSYLLLQIRASYFNLLLWNAGRIHFCRHTIVFIWKENNFFLLCSAPSFSRINFEFILIFFSHLIHPLCWKFSRFSIFSFFVVSLSHLNTTSI